MDYILMSNLYPKEIDSTVRAKLKYNMYDAANELQWNLISGLVQKNSKDNVISCNLMPVDSWPTYYKDWTVPKHTFSVDGKTESISVPFCNIKYIKQLFVRKNFLKYAVQITEKSDDFVIVVYSLNAAFLNAVKVIKKTHPNVKCIAIVADLPQHTSTDKNLIRRLYKKKNVETINKLLPLIDGYILLTEHMAEKLQITQPYIVMEGIAKENPYRNLNLPKFENKTIFYSGSLNKRYGILQLLDAFQLIPDNEYRLVLCGMGDAENEIKCRAETDSRICFLGKLPHDKVLEYQCRAHVLVNPRLNHDEFTKYSFPSKNLEYLASGTPVIAYSLDGIPDEYKAVLHYPIDDTAYSLSQKIREICESEQSDYSKTESFLFEKTPEYQAMRLCSFVKRLNVDEK